MKYILILFLILSASSFSFAQNDFVTLDFSKVDAYAVSVKNITDLKQLSQKLTGNYTDTIDKVRAIYRWVADNIAYDCIAFKNPAIYQDLFKPFTRLDSSVAMPKYQLAVANYVMKERKAICYGYAKLFKTLCDDAGIEAIVIDGYGKNGSAAVGKSFPSNHSWNAVKIGGKWFLLDATWGAGTVSDNTTTFKKGFNDGYFLTPPSNFILDHYPLKKEWALVDDAPTLEAFFSGPIIYPSFQMHKLHLVGPVTGIIDAKAGDKIKFEIMTDDTKPMYAVFDETMLGSKNIHADDLMAYTYPDPNNKKIISYEYTVKSRGRDLYVVYGMESILKYRIKN